MGREWKVSKGLDRVMRSSRTALHPVLWGLLEARVPCFTEWGKKEGGRCCSTLLPYMVMHANIYLKQGQFRFVPSIAPKSIQIYHRMKKSVAIVSNLLVIFFSFGF